MDKEVIAWRHTLIHAARTGLAAAVALVAARLIGFPEAYWAPITTLIVVQPGFGAALTIAVHRFAGTALGAVSGALLASRFGQHAGVFGAGVFLLGLLCAALRLGQVAYRFAAITLAIVMLVAHRRGPWEVALHRFVEVSVGIAVGLLFTAIWPHRAQPEIPPEHAAAE